MSFNNCQSNSLNLLGIPSFWQEMVIGAVVIGGTVFSVVFNYKRDTVRTIKRRAYNEKI